MLTVPAYTHHKTKYPYWPILIYYALIKTLFLLPYALLFAALSYCDTIILQEVSKYNRIK